MRQSPPPGTPSARHRCGACSCLCCTPVPRSRSCHSPSPGGATVKVPETFGGQFGVMLFYRGSWCPCCNAQLRAFQRVSAALAGAGVQVAALSVDAEATTVGVIAKHGLTFPAGFGADPRDRGPDRRL